MFTIYKENGFYNVNLNLGSLTKDEVNTLCQKLIKLEVEFCEDIGYLEKEDGESNHKGDPNQDEEAGDVEDKNSVTKPGTGAMGLIDFHHDYIKSIFGVHSPSEQWLQGDRSIQPDRCPY